MNYNKFLESKQKSRILSGFDIEESELNNHLFPFQKYVVKIALKHGKFALFEDCGLGKTIQQLEWAHRVALHTNKPVLILAPLAVAAQTIAEGKKFDIHIQRYDGSDFPIQITNYEQLENVNCFLFGGVVLDESSIIKNFEGKLRNRILSNFADTPYKLACTATPSPNDPMELGNHAEFLNVMTRNQMLAMYFVHDGGQTSKWRIKGHAERKFWEYVSTWAIMINSPSDIGYPMPGFDLPKLHLIEKMIYTEKRNNGKLFNDAAVSATNFNQELRLTKQARMDMAAKLANEATGQVIIWIKHNDEGQILKRLIPDAVEVSGSDTNEYKEKYLIGFANNEFRVLITKSKIAQFGLNFQNCHNQIFASLDFSFEGLYQSIRRSYRFGQDHEVNIYLIVTDTMLNVAESISRKQIDFKKMQDEMAKATSANVNQTLKLKSNMETKEYKSDECTLRRGDCVTLIKDLPDESVGFSVFSPPFAELYTYSDHIEDMGNSKDYKEFLIQFGYLVRELYRVIEQGRNVAVHCMDLPIQKGKEGFIGLRDFSNMIRLAFEDVGFIYHSRVTIWKDPVTEMQRTKALGLLHKQIKKDATMSRVGLPDYVLVFRKDGERNNPVKCTINVDTWQKYASPIWDDIDYSNTLNKQDARGEKDEKHIAPLQLGTISRLITLYTNEGDVVLSPFAGIGSEIYQAIKMNRKGIGFELKESYFNEAVKNVKAAEMSKNQLYIFE